MVPNAKEKTAGTEETFDVWSIFAVLWARKWWIVAFTGLVTAVGFVKAVLAVEVWASEALIAPKDSKGSAPNLLSQLGGLGGIVASSMGSGGGGSVLDRWEIMIKGREMAETVISKHGLKPNLFPEQWDEARKAWKPGAKEPSMDEAVERLRNDFLKVTPSPKKNVFFVGVHIHQPTLAAAMVDYYLEALAAKIREDARRDADTNIAYLNEQMVRTPDPLMKEKIQGLIAMEIEKGMLSGAKAFDVLERPVIPKFRLKPNRKQIVILCGLAGLLVSCLGTLLVHSVSTALAARRGHAPEAAR